MANCWSVARCVTDFVYACYMSELAVDEQYQRRGIGKELIRAARSRLVRAAACVCWLHPMRRLLRSYRFRPQPPLLGADARK
jgi:predicted N-acetyltransferase YhbS